MDIDDLKPCPFCGGEASTEREGDRRASHIIACTECGARMETGETGDQRGNAWNTRPTEDALRERVKVLEEALLFIRQADSHEMLSFPECEPTGEFHMGICGQMADAAIKDADT